LEQEVDHEFMEPVDGPLALALLLEVDDAELCESTEFLVYILNVSIDDA
jgi:hypothetical protein